MAVVDGPGDCPTEWSKSEREKQMSYNITYMWNLKKWYRWQLWKDGIPWNAHTDWCSIRKRQLTLFPEKVVKIVPFASNVYLVTSCNVQLILATFAASPGPPSDSVNNHCLLYAIIFLCIHIIYISVICLTVNILSEESYSSDLYRRRMWKQV